MKLPRRQFFHLAAGAVVLPSARFARAQGPVHLIVGYPAGGPLDTSARLIAQWLSERLGQPFIIENRSGAGSNLATETVVRAPPDGYTLLEVSASNAWNATLYENLNFNFINDIVPIASVRRAAGVMEVNPSLPTKTVAEFIGYAKANPGKINMATAGVGSAPHLYGELFKMMAGVDLVTVNYRGSAPALPDLLGGQDQVMFDVVISSIGHIKAGRLRPLGVSNTTSLDVLPDIRRSAILFPVTRRAVGMALVLLLVHRAKSSRSLTGKLMPRSLIPRSKPSSPIWAQNHLPTRPLSSPNLSLNSPRSGQR
jgi:tripartite-type tricarboxylate transporter receptor subunit TctC